MKKTASGLTLVGVALQFLAVHAAQAADPVKPEAKPETKAKTQSEVKATTGSDADRFEGDGLVPRAGLRGRNYKFGVGLQDGIRCVPRGSKVRGGDSVTTDGGSLTLVVVEKIKQEESSSCGDDPQAAVGDVLAASPDTLASALVDRRGWTYGTLIVPYKYQFKGDRSLSGGATLGGYFGWRETVTGTGAQLVVFGGATKVDVSKTDAEGAVTTESLAGLSYGVGILGTLKNDFKFGLVVGADRVSKSAGYVNNGKPWISLSLGVDFTQ